MYLKVLFGLFIYIFIFFYNFGQLDGLAFGNLTTTLSQFPAERIGPYFISTKSLEVCKGTREIDKTHLMETNVYVSKISRTKEEFRGFFYIPQDTFISELIVLGQLNNGGSKVTVFEKRAKRPCGEIFFLTFVEFFIDLNPLTCTAKHDNYTIKNADANKIVHLITGDNFIHETMTVNMEVFSKKGTVVCVDFTFELKPLKPKKLGFRRKFNMTRRA